MKKDNSEEHTLSKSEMSHENINKKKIAIFGDIFLKVQTTSQSPFVKFFQKIKIFAVKKFQEEEKIPLNLPKPVLRNTYL